MRTVMAALTCALVVAGACAESESERERADPTEPREPERRRAERGALDFGHVETVAGGLEVPWAIALVDDDTMLVTERAGRVRVIEDGRVRERPALEIDVGGGEGGLLGIALHPDFPDERSAYVYYTAGNENHVSRFDVSDDLRLSEEEPIIDRIPGGPNHDGGRIAFGPDELLYVGTGDAGRSESAADRRSLGGKILRVKPDGSIPEDNPFDGSPVYSYGHRNVQGLAFDSEGRLFASEHGPTGENGLCCHDEVNRVEAGSFYGWPFFSGRSGAADGDPPADHVEPLAESGDDTWAPSAIAVRGTSMFVANLGGAALLRLPLSDSERLGEPEVVLRDRGRLREVIVGPDECLYITTSNKDGRGSPSRDDDRVLRVCEAS